MVLAKKKYPSLSQILFNECPGVTYNHQLFTYSSWSIHQTLKQLSSFTPLPSLPFYHTPFQPTNQAGRSYDTPVSICFTWRRQMGHRLPTSRASKGSTPKYDWQVASPDWWYNRIIPWKVRIYIPSTNSMGDFSTFRGYPINEFEEGDFSMFHGDIDGYWVPIFFSRRKEDRIIPGRVHGYRRFSCVHGSFVGSSPYRVRLWDPFQMADLYGL